MKSVSFSHLTLRKKIIIAFIGFIIIPTTIISGVIIAYTSEQVEAMSIRAAEKNTSQVLNNIDGLLETMIKLSELPLENDEINAIISKDYKSSAAPKLEKQKDFEEVSHFIFQGIISFSDYVKSVVIYNLHENMIVGRVPRDYIDYQYFDKKLEEENWLKDILLNEERYTIVGMHKDYLLSTSDDYVVTIGRRIYDTRSFEHNGVILINLDVEKFDNLFTDLEMTPSSRIFIVDENDHIIYGSNRQHVGEPLNDILETSFDLSEPLSISTNIESQDVYMISSISTKSNWKVVYIIPQNELYAYIGEVITIVTATMLMTLTLSIAMAVLIATTFTRRLNKLDKKVHQIALGNFDVEMDIHGGQVGEISETVDYMLLRIRQLIKEIYLKEEEKRRAEMLALQTQINPHFIQNTVNAIKLMAHMQGNQSIEKATESFASLLSFTTRNVGDFISIEDEVHFIKDYIDILELRYINRFSVQYDIDEKILKHKTLKFLLQPIVENAVFHGFKGIEYVGELIIRISQEDDRIVFEVTDNGNGMDADLTAMLDGQSSENYNSIGVSNLYHRIKLFYGEAYGMSITSNDNSGTVVRITIPCSDEEGL